MVYYGEFLNFVFLQYLRRVVEVRLLRGGNEVFACHHVVDFLAHVALETQVAVRNDTHKVVLLVNNWNAANVELVHKVQRGAHRRAPSYRYGVVNHAVFGALHYCNLARLLLNRHVLVYYAYTAFAGYGDSHFRFRHRVHGSGNERYFKFNIA